MNTQISIMNQGEMENIEIENFPQESTDETLEETPERYVFYCYHAADIEKPSDTWFCPACNGMEECQETNDIHDNYDIDDLDCSVYHRQKFIAYLYPSTRKKYEDEDGMYALANLCLWNEQNEDFDELTDDEYVEDASDDMYVCYDDNDKEHDINSYFRENNIHCCVASSGCTQFAEWHVKGKHPTN